MNAEDIATIREALENSRDLVFKDVTKSHLRKQALTALRKQALTALAKLEAMDSYQASHGYTAADMRTAAAEGYRDGKKAELEAQGQKPVAPQPQAEAVLVCGHHTSLLVRSAETGEPLYCELCDDKTGRRDAEQMETMLQEKKLGEPIAMAKTSDTIRNQLYWAISDLVEAQRNLSEVTEARRQAGIKEKASRAFVNNLQVDIERLIERLKGTAAPATRWYLKQCQTPAKDWPNEVNTDSYKAHDPFAGSNAK